MIYQISLQLLQYELLTDDERVHHALATLYKELSHALAHCLQYSQIYGDHQRNYTLQLILQICFKSRI